MWLPKEHLVCHVWSAKPLQEEGFFVFNLWCFILIVVLHLIEMSPCTFVMQHLVWYIPEHNLGNLRVMEIKWKLTSKLSSKNDLLPELPPCNHTYVNLYLFWNKGAFLTWFNLYSFQILHQRWQLYAYNPAKFLCRNFHTIHKTVKTKNWIINSKNRILILIEASMCLPAVQSYFPQHIQKENVKTKELLFLKIIFLP